VTLLSVIAFAAAAGVENVIALALPHASKLAPSRAPTIAPFEIVLRYMSVSSVTFPPDVCHHNPVPKSAVPFFASEREKVCR
jgi:hypothetical protein